MGSGATDTTDTTASGAITAESDWRAFAPDDVKGDLKALEPVKSIGDSTGPLSEV